MAGIHGDSKVIVRLIVRLIVRHTLVSVELVFG